MKILDVLSENIDDGTSETNDQSLNQLIRWARTKWLDAEKAGALPENEQHIIQKAIAENPRNIQPEPNTMAIGPFLRAAQARYGSTYHNDNPNWSRDEQRNTYMSGNRSRATDSVLGAASQSGDVGNVGDRAGRAQIDAKNAKTDFGTGLVNQASQLGQGRNPSTSPTDLATTNRKYQKQYQHSADSAGWSPEDQAAQDARLSDDDATRDERQAAAQAAQSADPKEQQRQADGYYNMSKGQQASYRMKENRRNRTAQ